jgi:hypothetical protein
MASRTVAGTGNWSNTATWGGTVPVDGDTVTGSAAYTVTFDANQSAFTTGILFTNFHCSLVASTSPGTYYLMMGSNWTDSTGQLQVGSVGTPYPVACDFTVNCKTFAIALSGVGAVMIYDSEPKYQYCKLTSAAISGATVLAVDRDVTNGGASDNTNWLTPTRRTVDICNVAQARSVDTSHAIASATSSTITLSSGLSAAKAIGAYIVLTSRHVQIIGTGTYLFNAPISSYLQCAMISSGTYVAGGTSKGCTFTGALSGGGSYAIASGVGNVVSGTITNWGQAFYQGFCSKVSGLIAGCGAGFQYEMNSYLTSTGLIVGCTNACYESFCVAIAGQITGCGAGLNMSDASLIGATLSSNTTDILPGNITGRGASLNSSTQVNFTSVNAASIASFCCDLANVGGVAGARKCWTVGGVAYSQAVTSHPAYGAAYQFVPSIATLPTWMQDSFLIDPGTTLSLCVWAKIDTLGLAPVVQLFTADNDPFLGGTPNVTTSFANNTTWQVAELVYTNANAYPVVLTLRASCTGSSGNMYAGWRRDIVTTSRGIIG